jgi:hypothetical protein
MTESSLYVIDEICRPSCPIDNGRPQGFEGQRAMRVLESNYGWNPIESEPFSTAGQARVLFQQCGKAEARRENR